MSVLLFLYFAITFVQVYRSSRHDGAKQADAIIVLGAATGWFLISHYSAKIERQDVFGALEARPASTGDAQNEWNTIMATAVLTMLPPVAVVVLMQRWFVKGLVESEK